jgi:hypothetical protein
MRIVMLGDIHGGLDVCRSIVRIAARDHGATAAIQVGDFGIFSDVLGAWRLKSKVYRQAHHFDIPLHVIDGNHEDHAFLYHAQRDRLTNLWATKLNLHYHPRGTITQLGDGHDAVSIGWLGGACHADRPQEYAGQAAIDRFSEQPHSGHRRKRSDGTLPIDPAWSTWVTQADRTRLVHAAEAHPARLDAIVSHSCPHSVGFGHTGLAMLQSSVHQYVTLAGLNSGYDTDCGEHHLHHLWNQLADRGLLPDRWIYGHFHRIQQRAIKRPKAPHCRGQGPQTAAVDAWCLGIGNRSPDAQAFIWDTSAPSDGGGVGQVFLLPDLDVVST